MLFGQAAEPSLLPKQRCFGPFATWRFRRLRPSGIPNTFFGAVELNKLGLQCTLVSLVEFAHPNRRGDEQALDATDA